MSWNTTRSAVESLEILRTLSAVCADLGGPLTRSVYSLVEQEDYAALVSFELDYNADFTVDDILYTRQILALYQKADFLPLGINCESVAARTFADAELKCLETNAFFGRLHRGLINDSELNSVLYLAQRKVASILGRLPSLDELQFEFGPGANTNVKATLACPRAKLGARLECSAELTPTVHELLSEAPEWVAHHALSEDETSWQISVCATPGKVTFVPKTAKTHRTISIEPLLNSFFQKGVGSYMRDRLRRHGVDLRDQTRNQDLACEGSVNGQLATIDLSSASDTISRNLVFSLLPPDWSEFLSTLVTREVTVPDSIAFVILSDPKLSRLRDRYDSARGTLRLEKFSSMGNGFTFELESTIFYGLSFAVCEHLDLNRSQVSVYGDDIIVPTDAVPCLTRVLEACGFTLNKSKSFSSGLFRESCGADYLRGIDIRPFYNKTLVSDRSLFVAHNWFIRHGERELAKACDRLCIPSYKLYGPDGYGDGHLIGSHSLRQDRKTRRRGWEGGYFDTYQLRQLRYSKPLPGDRILPVYSVYTRSGENSATDPDVIRGSRGYAKISIYTLAGNIFPRKV